MGKINFAGSGQLAMPWALPEDMAAYLEPGDVIGYRKDGTPIVLQGGGARNTYEDWIPEEWSGPVITRVNQMSAVESMARRVPMGTDTKRIPRSAGVGVAVVAKGSAYSEDESANDDVVLTARKLGKVIRIADEDLNDINYVDIIAGKQADWATSYAKFIDQATLAVTGAENGTTVPFTSLYKAITTTNSDTSYTANDNLIQTAGAPGYDDFSDLLGLVEGGDYYSEGDMVMIAHPAWRAYLREIKDTAGNPIFVQGLAGTPDSVFGFPVRWSLGAKTHATATDAPTGNPLMIVGNRELMLLGVRSGPESKTAGADTGAAFLTDEALLKMRARRAWAVGHEKGFGILEYTAS